jgi:hypothetical protein
MFFKKHLAAVIVCGAALLAFIFVFSFAVVQMQQARGSARNVIKSYQDAASIHREVAEKIISDTECNKFLSSLKKIDLPNDILKNALWKYNEGSNMYISDHTYLNEPVSAIYSEGTIGTYEFGVIKYKDKTALIYEDILAIDGMVACGVIAGNGVSLSDIAENTYWDNSLTMINAKYDIFPKQITGDKPNAKATYVETVMPRPINLYGGTTVTPEDVVVLAKNDLELTRPSTPGYYYAVLSNGRVAHYKPAVFPANTRVIYDDQSSDVASSFTEFTSGGCESKLNIRNGITLEDLDVAGKLSNGDTIYVYKDKEKARDYYSIVYYPESDSNKSISFEEFLAEKPYFIWFDGFGSAIEFHSKKFSVAAECGKPVIYLYPEKDMNVSVKVEPNGGFKFTEPAYNSGWNVWATTKSELTNTTDGASYPYLFWEGKAYNYQTPDKGFVIKRENVGRDMNILLSRLGLNKKETADFMEFWQPKLEVKPFVYLTFLPQTEFDKLAPLTVIPAPDKIIRVFMDYEPLDQFVYVSPLKIITPIRTGFTVVEWGGRLR